MAIQHNPNISVARLLALAQAQVTREVRSIEMPTGSRRPYRRGRAQEQPHHRRRALNNPSIFDRAAGGLTVSQFITDFGRTHNLVLSAKSNAQGAA